MSIQYTVLGFELSVFESPPITTRPGLPLFKYEFTAAVEAHRRRTELVQWIWAKMNVKAIMRKDSGADIWAKMISVFVSCQNEGQIGREKFGCQIQRDQIGQF